MPFSPIKIDRQLAYDQLINMGVSAERAAVYVFLSSDWKLWLNNVGFE